ncbi:MAG TPA: helix-turn-helix domain-containing protein [Acidimicrobiales bacterium]|nr:helix-turn-helix domain-containing protein [Acidimicrobiales bacterium]
MRPTPKIEHQADEAVGVIPRLLLTPVEAGSALGLSRSTIYRLLDDGDLHGVRVRGARRIPINELERFVARLVEAS